ncbi:Auxin response factor 10 [Hordeum vulgare]|nr:Auxin response factor 10 [Hordeum vulgare]
MDVLCHVVLLSLLPPHPSREKSPITDAPAPPAADGAAVYYIPQGHAEQATTVVDLSATRVPALLAYRISVVRFMADAHNDEVFAKILLVPIRHGDPAVDMGGAAAAEGRAKDDRLKPASFAKTLT